MKVKARIKRYSNRQGNHNNKNGKIMNFTPPLDTIPKRRYS